MDILNEIVDTARRRFGIGALKPYQILVTHRIMEQEQSSAVRDQIVILPTGTGKSLCFLVPACLCRGLTVIVYPLLSLINDQARKLDAARVPYVRISGGMTPEQRLEVMERLSGGVRIVLTTPESLQNPAVLFSLARRRTSLLVVDEAHVISQWGNGFRPSYRTLSRVVRVLSPHQVLAFTATASRETMKDIRRTLRMTHPLTVRGDADRPNVIYMTCRTLDRTQGLLETVRRCARPALVFCRTRPETEKVCFALQKEMPGMTVRYYHAGLPAGERRSIENWFLDSHDGVLAATSAYGMGVDKPDIRSVIHYRLPQSAEEFLQESGRAGRDGQTAVSWVLVTHRDLVSTVPYSPILDIFRSDRCRRSAILGAMGQVKGECTGCDVCLGRVQTRMDGEAEIRSLIRSRPFRLNPVIASYMLTGSRNRHIHTFENIIMPCYGSLENWNPRTLAKTIETLAAPSDPFPISSVRFCNRGKLLYPSGNLLYNFLAAILRRIDHGYNRIVRKARRRGKGSEKIRRPGETASPAVRNEEPGALLDGRKD